MHPEIRQGLETADSAQELPNTREHHLTERRRRSELPLESFQQFASHRIQANLAEPIVSEDVDATRVIFELAQADLFGPVTHSSRQLGQERRLGELVLQSVNQFSFCWYRIICFFQLPPPDITGIHGQRVLRKLACRALSTTWR